MIKKLIIVILLALSMFTINIKETYAFQSNLNDIEWEWETYNYYSNFFGMRISLDMPVNNVRQLTFTVPDFSDNLVENGNVVSQIIFDMGDITHTFDLADIYLYQAFDKGLHALSGTYIINLYAVNGYLNLMGVEQIRINVMQGFSSIPSGFMQNWNENAYVSINPRLAVYYDRLNVYTTEVFYYIPIQPIDPTPPTNYRFIGWMLNDGEMFDFYTIPTAENYDGTNLPLKAVYQLVGIGQQTPTELSTNMPEALADLLDMFGLYNFTGFIIVYIITMLLVVVPMIMAGFKTMIILISMIVVTGLFTFLGMLPLFAVILVFIALTFTLIQTFRGGN